MLTKILPKFFYRIQLRRVWRQRNNCNIGWYFHFFWCVKACLIPDHHNMYIWISLLPEFFEKRINRIRIQIRSKQANSLAGLRACRSEYIQVIVLSLSPCLWAGTLNRPLPCKSSLLTESCFILKPNFYSFSRIISTELPDLITDFFLKVSRCFGSPLGCWGREGT